MSSGGDSQREAARLQRKASAIGRAAAKSERSAAKLSAKAAHLQQVSEWLAAFDMWTRPEPGARRTRLNRDDISEAALKIADTEGFDALSMRRLAAELDVGTMSLYHYVRTKDELLMLLNDAVMAEVIVPEGTLPTNWREAMLMIAGRSRASLLAHPWVMDLRDDPMPGPNGVRHFDQSLQALSGLDLGLAEKCDLIAAVDEYVFGFCTFARVGDSGEWPDGMLDYFSGLIDSGEYPALAAMRDQYGMEGSFREVERIQTDSDRFERNLNRLLDGFGYS